MNTSGDATARSSVFDILRRKNWPADFDFRAIRNAIYQQWETRIPELKDRPEEARADYDQGVANADYDKAHIGLGESVGLISEIPDAASLIRHLKSEVGASLDPANIHAKLSRSRQEGRSDP